MNELRAIETRYKGYRFRSRLEARWAVFFDSLGIPWQYEKEGLVTDAGAYLPDFTLYPDDEDRETILEIKPNPQEAKADPRWGEPAEHTMMYAAFGAPWECSLFLVSSDSTDAKPNPGLSPAGFVMCPTCESILLAPGGWLLNASCTPACCKAKVAIERELTKHLSDPLARTLKRLVWLSEVCSVVLSPAREMIEKAKDAAKSARFEHGESGAA